MNLTITYFWNDYGEGEGPQKFVAAIARVYPRADIVNCAIRCKKEHMMAARTTSYSGARRRISGDMIFCDTDLVATKRVDVFEKGINIGVTRTKDATPLMPYNGGVIFASDTAEAKMFFDEIARCATVLPTNFGNYLWYIDQLALGYVAKGNSAVTVLDERYNYIPKGPEDVPEDVYFMHYKGNRKGWIKSA